MNIFSSITLEITEVNQRLVKSEWDHKEFNPFAKVYYVSNGTGQVEIAGETLHLKPGMMYFIPPYMPLKLSCDKQMHHYWVHFMVDRFSGGVLLDLARGNFEIVPDDSAEVIRLYNRLTELYENKGPKQQMQAQALLCMLLAYFLPDDTSSIPARELLEFLPTIEYIENNLDSVLSNDELAELHNWHPTYFANRFSRALGVSPRNYIINKRIEKARQLLWSGSLTIAEVSREVGFSDEYYFSRVFKKLTGIPPGRYQKQARNA